MTDSHKLPEYLESQPSVFNGNPPATTKKQELPFYELAWEDFEKLCLRVARKQATIIDCRQYGNRGDNQQGIDLYATKSNSAFYTVYQCKREIKFGPAKIEDAVSVFLQGEWKDKTDEFVLCVKEGLKSQQRSDAVFRQRKILKAQGIHLTIWDSDELNTMLKDMPDLVLDFFGDHWCIAFCGAERAAAIKSSQKLPSRRKFPPVEDYIERFAIVPDKDSLSEYMDQGEPLFDLIKKHKRIALVGRANDGKSTALQYLAYKLSAESVFYPYLVQLKNYTREPLDSHIPELTMLHSDQVVLLLDGLDEVTSDDFDIAVRRIRQFSEDNPNVRMVVSCRQNLYIVDAEHHQDTLNKFDSYRLKALTQNQVDAYLKRLHTQKGLRVEGFLQQVQEKQFGNLIFTPYYLIRLTGQFMEEGSIAVNAAEISLRFTRQLISQDMARHYPRDRTNKAREITNLLTKLAFLMEYSGKNVCRGSDLHDIFDHGAIKLIKEAGSVIQTTGDDGNWSFVNNNFQEVLVAKRLQDQKLNKILRIICFPPKYEKIKPSWTNTISLMISLIDRKGRAELLDRLTKENDELVIRFQPDNVGEEVRFEIFKKVFNHYTLQGKRINESKYSTRDLAQFGKSEKTFKYLLDAIGTKAKAVERLNALTILGRYNRNVDSTTFATELKARLEVMLYEKPESLYYTILAYSSLFRLSKKEFTKLLNAFFDSTDTWVLTAIYRSILLQKYHEMFLDRILQRTLEFIQTEYENREGRLADEYLLLNECLTNLTTEDSLLKLLDFLGKNFEHVLHSIHFSEIVDYALKSALSFNSNPEFYNKIRDMFLSWDMSFADDRRDKFMQYFDQSGTQTQLFRAIILKRQPMEPRTMLLLAKLADEECLNFMADEFANGKINKDDVEHFQQYLGNYNPDRLHDFNALLNKVQAIPLPVYRDYEMERKNQMALTAEVLFSKKRFIEMIHVLFGKINKTNITYDDVWNHIANNQDRSYPPVLLHIIHTRDRDTVITAEELKERLNNKWDFFHIEELYKFLKSNPDIRLLADHIAYIKKWCEFMVPTVDFTTATKKNGDHYTTEWNAIFLSFFIRHLNFTHLDSKVYLDMLSFEKWDDNGPEIVEFVEGILPEGEIRQRMLDNLGNQSVRGQPYLNHITYCKDHNLKEAARLLLPYIQNHETFHRHKTLEIYNVLGGAIAPLEHLLDSVTDPFRYDIIRLLITKESPAAKSFVIRHFKKASTEEERLSYGFLLIQMQNSMGISFLIKHTKSKKVFPTVPDGPYRPYLGHLTRVKFLRLMFQLYQAGQDPLVKSDMFSDPRSVAVSAIHSICLYKDNFKKALSIYRVYKWAMTFINYFRNDKRINELLQDLDYQFEIIESKYYVQLGASVTIKDAESMYESLDK